MQQQIQCPQCNTPFVTDVYQIIDVGQVPQLKQAVLSGQINQPVCPQCNASMQIASPILYHDPAHELFMVYVPMGMSMSHTQEEQMIGSLVKQAVDSLPVELRKGYMFNPQKVLQYQTFMEKILETEGVTSEMIARQKEQAQLLEQLLKMDDKNEILSKIADHADDIDETIFSILQSGLQAAIEQGNEPQMVRMTNLQAWLLTKTATGRALEKRQLIMMAFQKRIAAEGGLTPALMADFIVDNNDDWRAIEAVVMQAPTILNDQLFQSLEASASLRQGDESARLEEIGGKLMAIRESYLEESQRRMDEIRSAVRMIAQAQDQPEAIRQNGHLIDESFIQILSMMIGEAEETEDLLQAATLKGVYSQIMAEAEKQIPPQIRLINNLVQAESIADQNLILDGGKEWVSTELLEAVKMLTADVAEKGDASLVGRLEEIQTLIAGRLA